MVGMRDLANLTAEEAEQIRLLNAAIENAGKADGWLRQCREGRDEAINALRGLGWTIADVAALSGLSPAAIAKIGDGVVPGRKKSGGKH